MEKLKLSCFIVTLGHVRYKTLLFANIIFMTCFSFFQPNSDSLF
ncbi:Uncharacterized protein dnm_073800 [Desulfonema magnum]|uniref:Uncharacterized protein n=1 Tax=Desulfonema magnum TaxID=45655 RepID=A0A975GRQ7_9BACT|nr:Uncharacterized protein dnm_073800 [Desulfonema magnum]